MSAFEAMLAAVSARPGLYVGETSLRAVADYLAGYGHGLMDLGHPDPQAGWARWVETNFLISHPAGHWTRILVHVYGSDRAALDVRPSLDAEFRSFVAERGVENIDAEHYRRFVAAYGEQHHGPAETHTGTPPGFAPK